MTKVSCKPFLKQKETFE